jgi:hypothetical protein
MGELIDVEENVKLQIEKLLTDDVFAALISSGIANRSSHFL